MNMMQSVAAINRRKAGAGGAPFDPMDLSPAIWLDASDSSTIFNATSGGSLPADTADVLRIEDKSGNGRHFTESSAPPSRAVASVNGLDTVRIQNSEILVRTAGTFAETDMDNVFAVLQTSDANYVLLTETSGGNFLDATEASGSAAVSGAAVTQFRVNGANVGATRGDLFTARGSATSLLSAMGIGSQASAFANLQLNYPFGGGFEITDGYFCELLVIPGSVGNTDRDNLESYLMTKWGI
jgi:hypothetical protein